jgi:2-iminobutanoate/2-iminopropanoate deaminase
LSEKRVVRTEIAPAPFQGAPYNQAITAGGLVFVSGQLGLVPGETTLEGKSIETQTRQVLENIKAILEEAGSGLGSLLKTTVFLADLADFAAMNAVYSDFVGEVPPARATVQVAALPSGALVEIDAVALVD